MPAEDTRYAAVIEPGGALRDMVAAMKRRMADAWPASRLVSHPPHGTLWYGRSQAAAGAHVAAAVRRARPFAIRVRGPRVFHDDALAGGGQTCVLEVERAEALDSLQRLVAEAVAADREPDSDEALAPALRVAPYLESWRRYGFPFVGSHWIPHFTIGSLPCAAGDRAVAAFLDERPAISIDRVTEVAWWRVDGDLHEVAGRFPLGEEEAIRAAR
jgi:hypothetical protein